MTLPVRAWLEKRDGANAILSDTFHAETIMRLEFGLFSGLEDVAELINMLLVRRRPGTPLSRKGPARRPISPLIQMDAIFFDRGRLIAHPGTEKQAWRTSVPGPFCPVITKPFIQVDRGYD